MFVKQKLLFMDKKTLLEKIENEQLSDLQILEIEKIIASERVDNSILDKIEKLFTALINSLNPSTPVLIYRFCIYFTFCLLIYLISERQSTSDTQLWTIIGTFLGFVFGQKSSILRI